MSTECSVRRLEIALDSQNVVWILSKVVSPHWNLRNLVQAISNSLGALREWKIYHLYRESNRASDWLSSRDSIDSFFALSGALELKLVEIVNQDKARTWYFRN